MYSIEVTYRTGNSFGSLTETESLGYVWESLDEATEFLKYIKEHMDAVNAAEDSTTNGEYDNILIEASEKVWFTDRSSWQYNMMTKSGRSISTFWIGYFETLLSARVTGSELEITL